MIILLVYFFLYFTISFMILLLFLRARRKNTNYKISEPYPFVSVLVAARNEEECIVDCLQSLVEQDYPADKIEILVGNDASTDSTPEIVRKFSAKNENVKLINIEERLGKARGKANVLAHLANKARGSVLLITDADMVPGSNWVRSMSSYSSEKDMFSGFTVMQYFNSIQSFQSMEWKYYMAILYTLNDLFKITAVGNNMGLNREVYFKTGGYENFDFSVTEDYKLSQEVISRGYCFSQILDQSSISFTKPINKFNDLLDQRKRWMSGGRELPPHIIITLLLYAFYPVALILLLILNFKLGLLVFLLEYVFILPLVFSVSKTSEHYHKSLEYLLFPLFKSAMVLIMAMNYLFSSQVRWKERHYL